MTDPKSKETRGGVNIHIGRDVDKSQVIAAGGDVNIGAQQFNPEYEHVTKAFVEIYRQIQIRPPDPNVDKSEIQRTVENIEAEVLKSDGANARKVRRWLRFLAEMAPDIFDVVVNTLVSPIYGVSEVIRKVAKRATSNQ
jgi:hypothetical protein